MRRLARREAITLGRFHQYPPRMAIARLGDRPLATLSSTAVLTGHQPQKSHQLLGGVKTPDIAQLRQQHHRRQLVDAS
jgi:hypothetical protein